MKTFPRSFALLATGVLAFSLTACSGGDSTPPPTVPTATATADTPATDDPAEGTAPAEAVTALESFLDAQYSYSPEVLNAFTTELTAGESEPTALLNEFFPEMMATVDQSTLGSMPDTLAQAMMNLTMLYSQDMTVETAVNSHALIVEDDGTVTAPPESVLLTVSDTTGEIGETPSDLTYKVGEVNGQWLLLSESFATALPEPLPEELPAES